jgi:UDP-N-acetylmuramate: L-alanyl-gamma-D-glutamyl-meso-diaminopimelate ligase
MHVHLIGVAGTGMGAFAGLLKAAGHRVTGSDTAFYPPMGEALAQWGIETRTGFDPRHLEPAPDLVVIGNVCRRDNPEARAAIERGLPYRSFPKALGELFLANRRSLVIAGTHGKTTTSALTAYLLEQAGLDPSFLVGGIPKNFGQSFRLGSGSAFVVEGDEYDSAFFEKIPKFWSYRPWGAVITSLEHDHVDIYPTLESYRDAFRGFVSRFPTDGVIVANAADREVVRVCERAPCRVVYYALESDTERFADAIWTAAPIAPREGVQPFELFVGGARVGLGFSPLMGEYNVRNATAALVLLAEGLSVPPQALLKSLQGFQGVRRRQELRGIADGVRVYDDFAHHPTAVDATLRAMRRHHPEGRLLAIFEPRSATASRNTHQADYPGAFDAADVSLIAPVGRPEIAADERLDVPALVAALRARGRQAETVEPSADSVDAIVARVTALAQPGDTVAVLSNGAFGGIHGKLLAALAARSGR